jgi:hypothetical protein
MLGRTRIHTRARGAGAGAGTGMVTDLEKILALSPSVLYWRAQSPGTVARDGTGAVATNTEPVGRILDLSGNGNYAAAPADGNRSTLNATGWVFDGTDDYYSLLSAVTIPVSVTIVRAFRRPLGLTISAGLGNASANSPYEALWFNENTIFAWLDAAGLIQESSANASTGAFVVTTRKTLLTQTLRLNGAAVTTTPTIAVGGTQLNSFGRRNANYNAGEISFLAVFAAELTGADLALVEQIAAGTNGATLA